MPRTLTPIPVGTPITDAGGMITTFFRQAWQLLVDGWQITSTVATASRTGLNANLATTALWTTLAAGNYRISYNFRRTTTDGVASSLQATLGWTQDVPLTQIFGADANDSISVGKQNGSILVYCDASTDITIAIAYSSTTPGNMKYRLDTTVEYLGG